jgi:hypothetical protein
MTMKIVVVLVRNLGARWLGAYGNEWVATPNVDRLAAEGIVFERHIAERTDCQSDSYVGDLKRFDELVPPWDVPKEIFETYAEEHDGLEIVKEPRPFGQDDMETWDAVRYSYAATLTRLDAKLGQCFDACRRDGSTIIFTSDIGIPLGEHGITGTLGSSAHEELVHLPLIVWFPDGTGAGNRVANFTQPESFQQSIIRYWGDCEQAERAVSAETKYATLVGLSRRLVATTRSADKPVAIRTSEWTCLFCREGKAASGKVSLYRTPEDLGEQNDLAERCPEIVEELTAQIE